MKRPVIITSFLSLVENSGGEPLTFFPKAIETANALLIY